MIKTNVIRTNWGYSLNQNCQSKLLLLNECRLSLIYHFLKAALFWDVSASLIFSLNYQQGVTQCCIRIDKWEDITKSSLQTN